MLNLTKKNQSHSPPKRGRLTTVKADKPKSIFGGIIEVNAENDSPDSVSLTSRSGMTFKELGRTPPVAQRINVFKSGQLKISPDNEKRQSVP